MLKDHPLYCILVLVFLFVSPTFQFTHYPEPDQQVASISVSPCHLYGDTDTYGSGVSASYYLQWFTSVLVTFTGVENEAHAILTGFNIIGLAVLANLYLSTISGGLATLEWYIISGLVIFLPLLISVPFLRIHPKALIYFWLEKATQAAEMSDPNLDLSSYREHLLNEPLKNQVVDGEPMLLVYVFFMENNMARAFQALLVCVYLFSQPWLNWKFYEQGRNDQCRVEIFIFYTFIDLYSRGLRIFFRVSAVISVVTGIIYICYAGVLIYYGLTQAISPTDDTEIQSPITEASGAKATPPPEWVLEVEKKSMKLAKFISYLVELTIAYSKVGMSASPITSTGQLLPLLVGIFSFFSVLWALFKKYRKHRAKIAKQRDEEAAALKMSSHTAEHPTEYQEPPDQPNSHTEEEITEVEVDYEATRRRETYL